MKRNLVFLLLVPLISFAQRKKDRDTSAVILQPDRIEFELSRPDSEFYVVNGGVDGLLVVEETTVNAAGGQNLWNISVIDTAFKVVWRQALVLPAEASILGHQYFGGQFYLLFRKKKYASEELVVYLFEAREKQYLKYDITTVFPLEITHFEVLGQSMILGGYANFRPVVLTYDVEVGRPQIVPGFYDNRNEILDIFVDQEARFFTVVLSEKMRSKRYTVRVKTFTEKGDLIQNNLVNPGERRSLIDAATTTFSGGLQYMAGTHSRKSSKYSQGFYLSKFINGQQQLSKYYPFADLNNFFDHLKPKREERIKKRIERKRKKGKIKRFNYRLLVHDIIERQGEYIMVAEAYYPRYNYSSGGSPFLPYSANRSFGQRGRMDPFFLGYKYTHAVVLSFDTNCNLLWNHTFKIEDIMNFSLSENVVVSPSGDRVILMYLEENEIRSKVVEKNEVVEGRTFNPVRLSFQDDELKTKDPLVENLQSWYENKLFASGEQTIKNRSGVGGRTNRKVFYINKIQYELGRELN